jgi:hypothetical protein
MARPKRFELLTPRFVVWCSIRPAPTIGNPKPTQKTGTENGRRFAPTRGGGRAISAELRVVAILISSQAAEFANPKNPHCFPMATL